MSRKSWWKRQQRQKAAPPNSPQAVQLLLAEQIAIQSILDGRAELDRREKQIIADIAGLRQMTPEQLTSQYIITPQGLIPQPNAALISPPLSVKDDEPTAQPEENADRPAVM